MRAGIIAAGEGSRFRRAGVLVPKPLIEVGGVSLIERTLRAIIAAGADEIGLIVNEDGDEVLTSVRALSLPVPIQYLQKTTPGSFASLAEIVRLLTTPPFLLSTIDTIAAPGEVAGFARAFKEGGADVLLAYTDYIDDEAPLRIAVGPAGRVTALGADAATSPFVTAGLYGLGRRAAEHVETAQRAGILRLRDFLGMLLEQGLNVRGHRLTKAIDVDRPHDLRMAEEFVSALEPRRCA